MIFENQALDISQMALFYKFMFKVLIVPVFLEVKQTKSLLTQTCLLNYLEKFQSVSLNLIHFRSW